MLHIILQVVEYYYDNNIFSTFEKFCVHIFVNKHSKLLLILMTHVGEKKHGCCIQVSLYPTHTDQLGYSTRWKKLPRKMSMVTIKQGNKSLFSLKEINSVTTNCCNRLKFAILPMHGIQQALLVSQLFSSMLL